MVAPPRSRSQGAQGRRLRAIAALAAAAAVLRFALRAPAAPAAADGDAGAGAGAQRGGGGRAAPKLKVGWVGHVFGERPPSGLSFADAQPIATDNSGNLVWAYGAWTLVDPAAVELVPLIAPPYEARVHAVLLPTANMLVNASKFAAVESYQRVLERILGGVEPPTTPVLLIAIGSQVEFEEAPLAPAGDGDRFAAAARVRLHPDQVAFLQRIFGLGGLVTTRGRFTQRIFKANGLPQPLPLSCPSLFLNHNPRLGEVLRQKWDAVLAKRDPQLRLGITLPNVPAGQERQFINLTRVLAEGLMRPFRHTAVVIMQTTRDVDTLEIISDRHGVHLRPDRVRYYYDVQSWVEGVAACCDLVVGFRIHGGVAAMSAEVPGLVLPTDMRITELVQAMRLPSADVYDVPTMRTSHGVLTADSFNLFDFMAAVPQPYAGFDANRRHAAKTYSREFRRLGVPLHPGVEAIARRPAAAGASA